MVASNFKDEQYTEKAKKADLRKRRSLVTLWTIVEGTLIRIWQRFKREEKNSASESSGKGFSATTLGYSIIFSQLSCQCLILQRSRSSISQDVLGVSGWRGRDVPPLCQFQQGMRVAQWVKNGDKGLITCR